jgi:HK97 family phage portal protein
MTIRLMENTANGDKRVVNELSRRVDIEPCRNMTRKQWIYSIVQTMMLSGDGNQVTIVETEPSGQYIGDMIPVPASQVSFRDRGAAMYDIVINGHVIDPSEVLHFVDRPDPEKPWIGTGMRVALKDTIACIAQAGETKRKLMQSPAPSIIVKVDGLSEDFQSSEGRKKLRNQYIDASENGEPWMIPAEAFSVETVKPLSITDLAIRDNLELDKRAVAAMFGVPPFLVGVGTYNEDEYNNFVNTKIMGKAQILQQEMTRKLLISKDWYFKFNPRSLYNYKIAELVQAGQAMVQSLAMTRNEWRDWMTLDPREDMEEIIALENYIPADKLGDQKKLIQTGGDE